MTYATFPPRALVPPMPISQNAPPLEEREAVGLQLRKARKAAHLSTAKAAELGGLSVSQLGSIERGTHSLTSISAGNLRPLAEAFGLSWAEFAAITAPVYADYIPLLADAPPQRPLPETLLEASERYGDTHKALRNPSILQQLAAVRHWDGGPRTAEDWVDFYIDNRRRFRD